MSDLVELLNDLNQGNRIEYDDYSQLMFCVEKLEKENEELKKAIKDHRLFRQNEVINFTSKCVWEALNPETKMCIPNAMYIKIEELLKNFIENGAAE